MQRIQPPTATRCNAHVRRMSSVRTWNADLYLSSSSSLMLASTDRRLAASSDWAAGPSDRRLLPPLPPPLVELRIMRDMVGETEGEWMSE